MNHEKIIVDVLMPVYNQENYIEQAIESVLCQQTDFTFRLLIRDDGSTDQTYRICTRYRDAYPDVIVLSRAESNGGLVLNYKALFGMVTATYIAILEGDDYWIDPEKLRKQVAYLEQHPACVLVNTFSKTECRGVLTATASVPYRGEVYATLIKTDNYIFALTAMFRASVFFNHVDFEFAVTHQLATIDYFIWLELSQHGQFYAMPYFSSVYRQLPGSISNSANGEQQLRFARTVIRIKDYYLHKYPLGGYSPARSRRRLLKRGIGHFAAEGRLSCAALFSRELGVCDFESLRIRLAVVYGIGQKAYLSKMEKKFGLQYRLPRRPSVELSVRKKPLLSVIVPMYNVENYVEACVESLLAQDYRPLQLILVDDGSTDGTRDRVAKYLSFPELCLLEKANGGLSSARNAGLEVATGDYISFVDSDDVVSEDVYTNAVAILEAQDELDFVQYPICFDWQSDNERIMRFDEQLVASPQAIFSMWMKGVLTYSACDKVFRAKIFDTQRFPYCVCEDMNMFHALSARLKKVAITDKGVYYYRYTDGSIMNTNPNLQRTLGLINGYRGFIAASSGCISLFLERGRYYLEMFDNRRIVDVDTFSVKERREILRCMCMPAMCLSAVLNVLLFRRSFKRITKAGAFWVKLAR